MEKYINPIPNLDDELVSKDYCVCFKFQEYVSRQEALEAINQYITERGEPLIRDFPEQIRRVDYEKN